MPAASTLATSVLPTPASPSRKSGLRNCRLKKIDTARFRSATYRCSASSRLTSSIDCGSIAGMGEAKVHYGRAACLREPTRRRSCAMNLDLDKRVALVAASTSGLGLACALGLAAEGVSVVVCSRDEQRSKATAADIARQTHARVAGF